MDFEDKDYLHYLYEQSLRIRTQLEGFSTDEIFSKSTLDQIDQISETFEREDGVVVVDDFLTDEVCTVLREYALINPRVDIRYRSGYDANDFEKISPLTISNIIGQKSQELFPFLGEYIRAWYVRHDYDTRGVHFHSDPHPSQITVNLWVTPNESFPETDYTNGLYVWRHNSELVNRVLCDNLSEELLKKHYDKKERISIPYRYNRVVFFNSYYLHSSHNTVSYTSWKDKKVNYAFLFTRQGVTLDD